MTDGEDDGMSIWCFVSTAWLSRNRCLPTREVASSSGTSTKQRIRSRSSTGIDKSLDTDGPDIMVLVLLNVKGILRKIVA